MKPILFLDSSKTNSMYMTGTRVDEWEDSNGSGKSIATAVSLGTSYNPTYNSALFGGRGGVTFTNKCLESATAFPELDWKKGFTIIFAKTVRNGFYAAADATGFILSGMGMGRCLGMGSAWQNKYALPDAACIAGMRWNGKEFKAILAGALYPVTAGSPSFGTAAFGKLQIGMLIGSAGAMDMDMAGIKIWDQDLPEDVVQTECDAMAAYYGISAPAAPKYNIIVDGNSLALGAISSDKTTMWNGLKAITGGALPQDMINVATSGLETLGMSNRASYTVDNLWNLGIPRHRRVLIVWEITNDLSNTTQTTAAAYANIKAYCQARKASPANPLIIVVPCIDRNAAGINTNFRSYYPAVNALLHSNAVAEGWADYVPNIDADTSIGIVGSADNTTYFSTDKTHLNSAGHLIAAGYLTTALNAIL